MWRRPTCWGGVSQVFKQRRRGVKEDGEQRALSQAKIGKGKETDQAFQELSPHVLQTISHRCERDGLSWFWCLVFHVSDLPAERQSQDPKLKAEGEAGPREGAWRREEDGRGMEMGRRHVVLLPSPQSSTLLVPGGPQRKAPLPALTSEPVGPKPLQILSISWGGQGKDSIKEALAFRAPTAG